VESVDKVFDHAISRAVSYKDLAGALKFLAATVDLLTGAEDPPGSMAVEWQAKIALPWGKNQFLRIGCSAERT
jgi:hypothetical protein